MKIRYGTKRYFLAELFKKGYTVSAAFDELRPKVERQEKPWIFSTNSPGGRTAKPITEQIIELQHEVNRAFNTFGRMGTEKLESEMETKPETFETPKVEKPRAKGKIGTVAEEKRHFYAEWKRLRKWIADHAERSGALPLDSLDTMRPLQAAKALIDQGISANTLIGAMCLHWPEQSRNMANVTTPDFHAESEEIEGEDNAGYAYHRLAGYVRKLVLARQNVMLIGPAGTGKSHLARQVAGLISTESHPDGLPYAETPMTPGATRGDLLGRHTISGFIPSQFVEIYSGGGVFNFEEIDASDPSMLIVVNNALASDRLYNSANGEVYARHPDFIAVATANTFGLGADAKYTGREKLDLATIDRFRMGRVLLTLDESLAESLLFN